MWYLITVKNIFSFNNKPPIFVTWVIVYIPIGGHLFLCGVLLCFDIFGDRRIKICKKLKISTDFYKWDRWK